MPNSAVFGATIENLTAHPKRRVDIDVGVDHSADIDRTREVLEAALVSVPGRLTEEPVQAYLVGLGGSSVDWQARVWCDPTAYWAVRMETIRPVKMGLDRAGIGIPFPQMDVHLDGALDDPAA